MRLLVGAKFAGAKYLLQPTISVSEEVMLMVASKEKHRTERWAPIETVRNYTDHGWPQTLARRARVPLVSLQILFELIKYEIYIIDSPPGWL